MVATTDDGAAAWRSNDRVPLAGFAASAYCRQALENTVVPRTAAQKEILCNAAAAKLLDLCTRQLHRFSFSLSRRAFRATICYHILCLLNVIHGSQVPRRVLLTNDYFPEQINAFGLVSSFRGELQPIDGFIHKARRTGDKNL